MFYTKPYADLLIVVLILLLFFGPKRLPQLGRSLGEGMREFKDSITGKSKGSDAGDRPELQAAPGPSAVASQPVAQTANVAASSERHAASETGAEQRS
jgi:sec-independent protein translocase protein TatA